MYIAHLTIEIALDGNDNLKAKRRVANSLKQKTRNKFNVAIAEDGTEDSLTLLRLAVVSTIGIGTIAASINAGGLGTLLFDGLRTMNMARILWGSLLSAGLAIATNALLKAAEDRL